MVFTLPAPVAAIAFHNKAAVYGILFRAAAEALRVIAADPRHLGAEIGVVAVLHTWGQAMQHHPHVHCIVPGGGLSPDGTRWIACPPGFFLSVKVLGRLFRRLFLERLAQAFDAGALRFFGDLAPLAEAEAFTVHCARAAPDRLGRLRQAPLRRARAGARLSRPLHPPRRHRQQPARRHDRRHGQLPLEGLPPRRARSKVMTLAAGEFIRRFLLHVLPTGFHRIRHYGFLANGHRTARLDLCRRLLAEPAAGERQAADADAPAEPSVAVAASGPLSFCPRCGSLHVIRTPLPRAPPATATRRR